MTNPNNKLTTRTIPTRPKTKTGTSSDDNGGSGVAKKRPGKTKTGTSSGQNGGSGVATLRAETRLTSKEHDKLEALIVKQSNGFMDCLESVSHTTKLERKDAERTKNKTEENAKLLTELEGILQLGDIPLDEDNRVDDHSRVIDHVCNVLNLETPLNSENIAERKGKDKAAKDEIDGAIKSIGVVTKVLGIDMEAEDPKSNNNLDKVSTNIGVIAEVLGIDMEAGDRKSKNKFITASNSITAQIDAVDKLRADQDEHGRELNSIKRTLKSVGLAVAEGDEIAPPARKKCYIEFGFSLGPFGAASIGFGPAMRKSG